MKKSTWIAFSSILLAFLALIIWTFFTKGNYLIIGGSTSCNEFMQEVTQKYKDEEVIYSSIGSQGGINSVKNHSLAAGFVSKSVAKNDFGGSKNSITYNGTKIGEQVFNNLKNEHDDNYFSLQFAYDAIEIVYYPPLWWNHVEYNNLNIKDLFSFYIKSEAKENYNTKKSQDFLKNSYTNSKYTWEELAKDIIKLKIKDSESQMQLIKKVPNTKTKFLSYTRESGSGTRDSFESMTDLKDLTSSNVCNSNGLMMTSVGSNPGSIGYISYAFSKTINSDSNIKVSPINDLLLGLQDKEEKCMKYDDETHSFIKLISDSGKEITNEIAIAEDEYYSFKRPFITLFNTSNKNFSKLLNFYCFMLGNEKSEKQISDIYSETGLVKKVVLTKY